MITGRHVVRWVGVITVVLLGATVASARAGVVLLDEYWSPEIVHNEVEVTEVDTEEAGDPSTAIAGDFSALLENESGWPSVRFRNAASLRRTGLLPGDTEGRLWYRTDSWAGKWNMEVWIYVHEAGRPVHVLTAELDGGGEDGRLIADDRWHQARGILQKGPEFDVAAPDRYSDACFVWLRPTDGWDVPHRTYVDRIEAVMVDGPRKGERPPLPARRVRPTPGAQSVGPGLVQWEGEDAVEESFPSGGLYQPDNAEQQRLLSNDAWLQHLAAEGAGATWKVDVPEQGTYTLWARGFWYEGGFRWRIDDREWHVSGPDRKVVAAVKYADSDEEIWGLAALMIGWTPLGSVELTAEEHTVSIECSEDATGHGFDCWALARHAFVPRAPVTKEE
ncbi:MAG: hypothetical protein R6X33_06515 [Candidatus Brocadiia bacterium]